MAALDPVTRGALLFAIPFQMLLQDRFADALAACEAHIPQLDADDAQSRTALLNVRNVCLLHLRRYEEIEEVGVRGPALATGVTIYGLVYAECIAGMSELAQGRLSNATAIFEAALTTAIERVVADQRADGDRGGLPGRGALRGRRGRARRGAARPPPGDDHPSRDPGRRHPRARASHPHRRYRRTATPRRATRSTSSSGSGTSATCRASSPPRGPSTRGSRCCEATCRPPTATCRWPRRTARTRRSGTRAARRCARGC